MTGVRLDTWLWSVRVFKTRSAAKAAITAGHVSVNGTKVKPAHRLALGDRIDALVGRRQRIVTVVELVSRRVGAERAAQCLADDSPPPPATSTEAASAERDRGSGRPTKRDRRAIDRLRGR